MNSGEHDPLTMQEWNLFISELEKINQRDALIARVLNWANGFLREPSKGGSLGTITDYRNKNEEGEPHIQEAYRTLTVTLLDVLSLQQYCVDSDTGCVSFWSSENGKTKGVIVGFSKPLLQKLDEFCGDISKGYVFTTANGNPIAENQVKRNFALASKRAGIRHISPKLLRLPIKGALYNPSFCNCDINCVCFCKEF